MICCTRTMTTVIRACQGTLYEWLRSLKINLPESTPLSDMVHRIANHPKLMEHSSTPVYAELVHGSDP